MTRYGVYILTWPLNNRHCLQTRGEGATIREAFRAAQDAMGGRGSVSGSSLTDREVLASVRSAAEFSLLGPGIPGTNLPTLEQILARVALMMVHHAELALATAEEYRNLGGSGVPQMLHDNRAAGMMADLRRAVTP